MSALVGHYSALTEISAECVLTVARTVSFCSVFMRVQPAEKMLKLQRCRVRSSYETAAQNCHRISLACSWSPRVPFLGPHPLPPGVPHRSQGNDLLPFLHSFTILKRIPNDTLCFCYFLTEWELIMLEHYLQFLSLEMCVTWSCMDLHPCT